MKGGKKNSPPDPPKKGQSNLHKKRTEAENIPRQNTKNVQFLVKEVVEGYSHDLILSSVAREKCDEGNVITRSSSTSNCDANI